MRPHEPVGDGVGVELLAQFAAGLGRLDMRSQHVADPVAERTGRRDGDRHRQASGENSTLSQRDPSTAPTQLIALGQTIGITDPSFASEIQEGRYLPWPSFVTEYAFARGIGGTPSVFVQGIPVPARPDLIVAAVERVAG